MSQRCLASCVLGVALFVLVACGGGGGGGGGPTAPPPPTPTLNVQGSWTGIWVAPVTVSMVLTQVPGTRDVTGTISAVGQTVSLRGTTTLGSLPDTGSFSWEVVNAGCGSWTGTMQVTGSSMNGPSRLSTAGCVNPNTIEGAMFLSRQGSALQALPATVGELGELARALRAGA